MEFLRKKIAATRDPVAGRPAAGAAGAAGGAAPAAAGAGPTTKQAGDAAEALALRHLQAAGLRLVCRNYRTPGRGGGEIDLVMRERVAGEDTLVFVEVRQRRGTGHGGAAASIGAVKQRRIVFAARHYLMRWPGAVPPCRFDVVTVEGAGGDPRVGWLRAAFDAG